MIKIDNLTFYYKRKPIFEEVSFDLKSGIYGLLGENGVGKTTLLHIISGLRFPKGGTCKVFDQEPGYRNPEILNRIFILPEDTQVPALRIKDFVRYNSVFYPNFSQEQFGTYLQEFNVEDDLKMTDLSFGQKKKALIAFAIASNTAVTLLDEPTNGLDIPSKTQFRKIIASACDDQKCTIISTHQVRDLESLIDPIIILDRNRVLLNSSVEEITEKLLFTHTHSKPENALYCEQTIQGYLSVQENEYKEESTLNTEALFNAVIHNKDRIKELFKA